MVVFAANCGERTSSVGIKLVAGIPSFSKLRVADKVVVEVFPDPRGLVEPIEVSSVSSCGTIQRKHSFSVNHDPSKNTIARRDCHNLANFISSEIRSYAKIVAA